ncbi:hypothetical protein RCC89_11220 [Cytophagaceae bacterium ABcell3]|nr:hypothetical protein RCC89_11220 [Cytophagaceae bacterium ABcell3]
MAKPSVELIDALRKTAKRVSVKSNYEWKDIGACNCGNLVQVVTDLNKKEISNYGIKKHGDWEMLVRLYKKDSGYKIDDIITEMLNIGFILDDLVHLENLSDRKILSRIPETKFLKRDRKDDVVLYLNTWADMMEEALYKEIEISEIKEVIEQPNQPVKV